MLALVLDRTHRVLCNGTALPEIAPAERPMLACTRHFAARGLALPPPIGSRARADGGRDFAFLVDGTATPAGMTWRPLRDVASDDAIWSLYTELVLGGYAPPARTLDVWSFGNEPEMAARLVHL